MRGTLLCTTGVLAAGVLLSACGSETVENAPRPPVPTVVSVSLGDDQIEVTPEAIGVPGQRPVNISQNREATVGQADPDTPLVVNVAISNLTTRDTDLFLEGPVDARTPLTGSGSGSFSEALPTGIYRFTSPVSTGTARLVVGPSRVSASGDLLIP